MKKNEWKYYSRIAYPLGEASPIIQPFIICTDIEGYGKGLTPIPHPLENYSLNSRISKFQKIGFGHPLPPPNSAWALDTPVSGSAQKHVLYQTLKDDMK